MNFLKPLMSKPVIWPIAGLVIGGVAVAGAIKSPLVASYSPSPIMKVRPVLTERPPASAALTSLEALDKAFADLVDYVAPAVVHIKVQNSAAGSKEMVGFAPSGGEGSGIIYRSDGWIVTNDHVVKGFDKVTVILNDGQEFPGTVRRSTDFQNDISVIKIEAKDLPTIKFGDSDHVRPGQYALAVGAPFGLENTVTIGHISGLGRMNQVGDMTGARLYSNMIQTDAPINPGNSGGPLINIDGEVVGVNSSIYSQTGTSAGIGFAIPSNQVKLIADMLIEKGKLVRGYLGVQPEDLKPIEKTRMKVDRGAILRTVQPSSPAEKAGLKPNDIVVRIGDDSIKGQQDLRNSMLKYGPGKAVDIEYIRDGKDKTASVKIVDVPKEVSEPQRQNLRAPNPFEAPEESPFGNKFRDFFRDKDDSKSDEPARTSDRPKLGVSLQPLTDSVRSERGIPSSARGALVQSVEPGSVAASLGIEAGDVITSIDGKTVTSPEDVVAAITAHKIGDSSTISTERYSRNSTSRKELSFKFR